jgi:Tol biopolymer transport system component
MTFLAFRPPAAPAVRAALVAAALSLAGCSADRTSAPAPARPYEIRALTLTVEHETSPAISPDGSRVAYVRAGAIYVLGIDGGGEIATGAHGDRPAWAPSGDALYYVRRDTGPVIHRLVRRDLGSGNEVVVSPDSVDVYEPRVSPDGARVAYRALSRIDRSQSLRVQASAGPGAGTRLVAEPGAWTDVTPSWTPDGASLVFVRLAANGDASLARTDASADLEPAAIAIPTIAAADPTCSPDGARIVFSQAGALVVAPATGGAPAAFVSGRGFALAPTFAAGGTRLAFASDRFGNFDVFLLTVPAGIGAGPYAY